MEDKNKVRDTYKIRQLTDEEKLLFNKCHSKSLCEYIRVGPRGYVLPSLYTEYAEEIRQMPVRSTDIWVVSFPRSGTTWTQELVWLVNNDLNFELAKTVRLTKRYTELELLVSKSFEKVVMQVCTDDEAKNSFIDILSPTYTRQLANAPSPRFIKCHMPLSLMPVNTLDTCKVVYVARDPRDVFVSFYHLFNHLLILQCELKEYFEVFIKNIAIITPYFEHVKEAWEQRNHPNMLFIFYEELSKTHQFRMGRAAQFCDHVGYWKRAILRVLQEGYTIPNSSLLIPSDNRIVVVNVRNEGGTRTVLLQSLKHQDLKKTAKKVADFFGKTYTEEQFDQLCEHLEFKNFQSNRSVSDIVFTGDTGNFGGKEFSKVFVRKGKAGGWRDEFDAEMTARAQAWMQDNLQDTDLRFPLQEF